MSIFSRNVRRSEPTVKPVNLKLVKISFWSAVRFGFVINIAIGIGLVIAIALVYAVLSALGATALLKEFVGLEKSALFKRIPSGSRALYSYKLSLERNG